jgi:hypothetical protein
MMKMMTTMIAVPEVAMTEELVPRETIITRAEAMTATDPIMVEAGITRAGSAPASNGRDPSSVSIAEISFE